MVYECIEDFPIECDYFGVRYGKGTVRKGTLFKVVREPTPMKKKYKMKEVNTKFDDGYLYLRKSELNRYFKLVK